MVVCKRIVDGHVLKVWFHVCIEELLDFVVVEIGVYEDSTNIGFDHVRKTL
jgi:hypothetical protein